MIPGSVMQACSRCAAPGPPANLMAGLADSQPTGGYRLGRELPFPGWREIQSHIKTSTYNPEAPPLPHYAHKPKPGLKIYSRRINMAVLTDYERQRLENIKKNQSLLSSLAIQAVGPAAKKGQKRATQPSNSTPSRKRSRTAGGAGADTATPLKRHATRASVRLSGIGLDPVELQSHLEKQEEEVAAEKKKRDALKHADRPLLVEDGRIGPDPSLTAGLFTSLASSIALKPLKTMKQEEVNLEYSPGHDDDYDRLAQQLNALQLRVVNKACPTRIYSMTFHPDPRKSLLFVGEKTGGIAIWNALGEHGAVKSEDVEDEENASASSINTAEGLTKPTTKSLKEEEEEEEEEEEAEYVEGTSYFIQAHARHSAVSGIEVHPREAHMVYTTSYDGTIRELNFESQQSTEVVASDALNPDEETLFSSLAFANDGREIWASDNAGGLIHRDLRLPKPTARRWTIAKKKIGCLSICPHSGDRLAVTAGLNREMRLWDLKALSGLPPSSTVEEVERGSCVGMYAHKLACSSAYFDAGGTKIVSTSYDDLVRVWEVEPSTKASWLTGGPSTAEVPPTFSARHDNQTGRWVSVMKARWSPNPRFPSHFTIGNMRQKLDIYSPKGELLAQLAHPDLTTVPAVTAQHPSSSTLQVAGATAGGKIYLWT
ncbi:hypothetical protein PCANC_25608 [Puccinia coronata f. sp. avenae]|uniref:DNA damage-binding protein CMR1 n=2 Tax=Puccinia coronata f. sp. avenae TaxID=200324 RepID=A0A2N5S265_9BASI|nr:hypothetical protein PCANC_25608 [Puccinia coronata f. sp. avenae]